MFGGHQPSSIRTTGTSPRILPAAQVSSNLALWRLHFFVAFSPFVSLFLLYLLACSHFQSETFSGGSSRTREGDHGQALLPPGTRRSLRPNWYVLSVGSIGGLLTRPRLLVSLNLVGTRLTVEEAALLDGRAGLAGGARDAGVVVVLGAVAEATAGRGGAVGRRQVGDVLRDGVLRSYGARVDAVTLASLGHGIVAAVEVLALLQVLLEVVLPVGHLAVQAEEPLLLGR